MTVRAYTGKSIDAVPRCPSRVDTRRVQKGQTFHQPYLGCREFPADVLPADDAPAPIQDSREIGAMLWDVDYAADRNRAVFFRASLRNGVLDVPETAEAALATLTEREGGAPCS